MKNAMNEATDVMDFLESAQAAALEGRRLRRRLMELSQRRNALKKQRGEAARKLDRLLEEERKREYAVAGEEMKCYRAVEAFVSRVPDGMHRTILRRRYLDTERSWPKISQSLAADGVSYSERQLARLHAEAVEVARRLWEQGGKEGTVRKRR